MGKPSPMAAIRKGRRALNCIEAGKALGFLYFAAREEMKQVGLPKLALGRAEGPVLPLLKMTHSTWFIGHRTNELWAIAKIRF